MARMMSQHEQALTRLLPILRQLETALVQLREGLELRDEMMVWEEAGLQGLAKWEEEHSQDG